MNYILDVLAVAVVVIFVISGYKRGILNSVSHFLGAAVASVISAFTASFVANYFYYGFIQSKIIEVAEEKMPQITLATKPEDISNELINNVPDFAKNALDILGIDKTKLTQEISDSAGISAPDVFEGLIRPIIMKLLTVILTLALFTILTAVISLLTRSLTSAVNCVGLSTVNKVFGAVLGLFAAVVIVMILSLVLYILIIFLPEDSAKMLRDSIESTYLLKYIYNINVPEMIITKILNTG